MPFRYKFLVLVLISAIAPLSRSFARPQGNESSTLGARAVAQPGLPLEIAGIFADSNPVAKETSLFFKLTNHTGETLRHLSTKVLWLDDNGKVLGGQITNQVLDTPNEATQTIHEIIRIQPQKHSDSGEFVLVVTELKSDSLIWTPAMPFQDVTKAMKSHKPVPVMASSRIENACSDERGAIPVQSLAALPAPQTCGQPDFCTQCHIQAMDDCNDCLLSFHCVASTCECSYTCRTDPPCAFLMRDQFDPQPSVLKIRLLPDPTTKTT